MKSRIKYHILNFFSLSLIFGFLISCGSSPSATSSGSLSPSPSQQPADAQSRQNFYMQYLQNEGYMPSIENGNITFSVEGFDFYVIINRTDPSFTIILLPNIIELSSDSDQVMAAVAVSYANSNTKVAKAYIDIDGQNNQYVSIAVEMYLENPNDFTVLFNLFLSAISTSIDCLIS